MKNPSFTARRLIFVPALLVCPAVALAANFATCLLDRLPGTANDVAASAALQVCLSAYPGGFTSVEQGAGRGWLNRQTGAECTLKKAGDTRSTKAASLIGAACRKLYDEWQPALQ